MTELYPYQWKNKVGAIDLTDTEEEACQETAAAYDGDVREVRGWYQHLADERNYRIAKETYASWYNAFLADLKKNKEEQVQAKKSGHTEGYFQERADEMSRGRGPNMVLRHAIRSGWLVRDVDKIKDWIAERRRQWPNSPVFHDWADSTFVAEHLEDCISQLEADIGTGVDPEEWRAMWAMHDKYMPPEDLAFNVWLRQGQWEDAWLKETKRVLGTQILPEWEEAWKTVQARFGTGMAEHLQCLAAKKQAEVEADIEMYCANGPDATPIQALQAAAQTMLDEYNKGFIGYPGLPYTRDCRREFGVEVSDDNHFEYCVLASILAVRIAVSRFIRSTESRQAESIPTR